MKYLFLFTVSPVQRFIQAARKTGDLYAGSRLLSELSLRSALFAQAEGANVIFPHINQTERGDLPKSIPNRFLAEIDADSQHVVKELGKELGANIQRLLAHWCKEVEDSLGLAHNPDFYKQVNNYFEWFYAFEPYNASFELVYPKLEKKLGEIKNLRSFQPFSEMGRKCSIHPEFNAVLYRTKDKIRMPREQIDRCWNANKYHLDLSVVNENEYISGITLLKRSAGIILKEQIDAFPSTAEIAVMDLVDLAKLHQLKKNGFDAQLIFKENQNEAYLRKHNLQHRLSVAEVKKHADNLFSDNQNGYSELTKYYAALMYDGDSMGKWLSGEFCPKGTKLQDFHRDFTKKLGDFALRAKELVDGQNRGRTVYAGGDDYFGLLNLHTLFVTLQDLRQAYHEEVNIPLKELYHMEKDLTFSAGVAISHYKMPLSETVHWAHEMETEAKNEDESKDKLAIAVLKHSGERNTFVIPWKNESGRFYCDSIGKLYALVRENFVSNGVFQKVRQAVLEFGETKNDEMVIAEVRRIVNRSADESNKQKINVDLFSNEMEFLYRSLPTPHKRVEKYCHFMAVLSFITREQAQ
jgi:CRISPR-associated protein Cmr2